MVGELINITMGLGGGINIYNYRVGPGVLVF